MSDAEAQPQLHKVVKMTKDDAGGLWLQVDFWTLTCIYRYTDAIASQEQCSYC